MKMFSRMLLTLAAACLISLTGTGCADSKCCTAQCGADCTKACSANCDKPCCKDKHKCPPDCKKECCKKKDAAKS